MLTEEEIQYKLDHEIIEDSHDEMEVSAGWFYYMEENLEFPFKATVNLNKKEGGKLKKEVKITSLASDEGGFTGPDFTLNMEIGDFQQEIKYAALSNIKATPKTLEAFEIWDYWIGKS